MTEAKDKQPNLQELITSETTYDDLLQIVSRFVTSEDEKVLGDKETTSRKIADSIAYLGAFAPAPATLDKKAFFATAAFDLSEEEAERLWEVDKRIGVLKEEPTVGEGRVSISPELVNAAKTQFLSD